MRTISSSVWRWLVAAIAVGTIALAMISLESGSASAGVAAQASRAPKKVDISSFAYHPPTLKVGVGARVAFVNSDGIAHTATRKGSFDTGRIKPGGSVVVRFSHRGSFAYHCTIHPFMHGKIVVQ